MLKQSEPLLSLQKEVLSTLNARLKQTLEELGSVQEELQKRDEELRNARARYDDVVEELRRIMEELSPYIEADRIVAEALPGAQSVKDLLDKAAEFIARAEEALSQAMVENERRNRREPLYLGEG